MNTQTLKGNWNVTKGKLKQKYAQLTDDDLQYAEGREDELIGRIQKKVGANREEIERFFTDSASGDGSSEQRRGAAEREAHVDQPLKGRGANEGKSTADARSTQGGQAQSRQTTQGGQVGQSGQSNQAASQVGQPTHGEKRDVVKESRKEGDLAQRNEPRAQQDTQGRQPDDTRKQNQPAQQPQARENQGENRQNQSGENRQPGNRDGGNQAGSSQSSRNPAVSGTQTAGNKSTSGNQSGNQK